jgi:type I restriction enzyme, S subunit
MKTYDSYKDSSIQWIGEIPEHWEVKKLGYISEMIVPMRDKPKELDGPIPWLRIEDFEGKYVENSKSNQGVTEEVIKEMNLKVLPIGTVLCSCSCAMGIAAIVTKPLITNQTFIGIVPSRKLDSSFLYYTIQSAKQYLDIISTGAIQTYLSRESFEKLGICNPSISEQTTIANYLDTKTIEIDQIITDKEALINLYEEEKKALINEAVTKGLNGSVEMKPCGVEWLSEIPKHWEVKRLKYLAEIKTGEKNTENNEEDGLYPFFVRSQTIERISTYSFDGEAILTAGDGVGVAKVFHYINGKFDYHQRVYRISHFKEIIGKFLFHYLENNLYKEVLKINAKSTVDSLRLPMFQNFMVAIPPISEQTAIVRHIETETTKINDKINLIKQEIELLKEYRQALIFEAVTGKIRVH